MNIYIYNQKTILKNVHGKQVPLICFLLIFFFFHSVPKCIY